MSLITALPQAASVAALSYPYAKTLAQKVLAGMPDMEPFHGWESEDGMVRCGYNDLTDGYYVDADEDHLPADLMTVLDLLESRGYEPNDDPFEDESYELLTGMLGTRVYFFRTADLPQAA